MTNNYLDETTAMGDNLKDNKDAHINLLVVGGSIVAAQNTPAMKDLLAQFNDALHRITDRLSGMLVSGGEEAQAHREHKAPTTPHVEGSGPDRSPA